MKKGSQQKYYLMTLYPIETPFNTFTNRADPDQAALVRHQQRVSCLLSSVMIGLSRSKVLAVF